MFSGLGDIIIQFTRQPTASHTDDDTRNLRVYFDSPGIQPASFQVTKQHLLRVWLGSCKLGHFSNEFHLLTTYFNTYFIMLEIRVKLKKEFFFVFKQGY